MGYADLGQSYRYLMAQTDTSVVRRLWESPEPREESVRRLRLSELVPHRFGRELSLFTSEEDLECLRRSIEARGIETPLIAWKHGREAVIVAGLNRYRIARELRLRTVPVILRSFADTTEAKLFAMSDNLARRHLTVGQKAMLALEYQKLITVGRGRRTDRRPSSLMTEVDSHSAAAKWAGVSTGSMANLRTVLDGGDATLLEDVLAGRVKLGPAARYVRDGQRRPKVPCQAASLDKSGPVYSCIEGDSSDLIASVAALYLRKNAVVADVTYGRGVFWRKVDLAQVTFLGTDLLTTDPSADFRSLPYADASIDVVVLDPPFQHNASTPLTGSRYETRAICRDLSHEDIIDLYALGMREAVRVLRPKGMLWVKCGDEIESGWAYWSHIEVHALATALHLRAVDLFILRRSAAPPIQALPQRHARKNHSFMWIFAKQSGHRPRRGSGSEVKDEDVPFKRALRRYTRLRPST